MSVEERDPVNRGERNDWLEGRIRLEVATDSGLVRKENQDNFYLCGLYNEDGEDKLSAEVELPGKESFICAVFDGMGGEKFGKEASKLAANKLSAIDKQLLEKPDDKMVSDVLYGYVQEVSKCITDQMSYDNGKTSGTTAVIMLCNKRTVRIYYAGDSRAYLVRNNILTLLTKDHTIAQAKIDSGEYSENEAKHKKEWNILTRYLGDGKKLEKGSSTYVMEGDKIIICSDGVTNMCDNQQIVQIISRNNVSDAAMLVQEAVSNSGSDNATCLVVKF